MLVVVVVVLQLAGRLSRYDTQQAKVVVSVTVGEPYKWVWKKEIHAIYLGTQKGKRCMFYNDKCRFLLLLPILFLAFVLVP